MAEGLQVVCIRITFPSSTTDVESDVQAVFVRRHCYSWLAVMDAASRAREESSDSGVIESTVIVVTSQG